MQPAPVTQSDFTELDQPPTPTRRARGLFPLAVVGLAVATGVTVARRRRRSRSTLIKAGGPALGLGILAGVVLYAASRRRGADGIPRPPVTQSVVSVNPADTNLGVPGRNIEQRLDEAIQESFPASDPISLRIE